MIDIRRTLLTALGVLCAGLSSVAQEKVEMLLWDKNPADTSSVKFEAIRASDFTRDPAITVYIPQNPNGKAIIMCPGGGYGWLAMGHEGHDMDRLLTQPRSYSTTIHLLNYKKMS